MSCGARTQQVNDGTAEQSLKGFVHGQVFKAALPLSVCENTAA